MTDEVDKLLLKINRHLSRDDVQPFEVIRRLADHSSLPKVWSRYFAGDFMAEVTVVRKDKRRAKTLTATGEGLEECLANLATAVADYLYPHNGIGRRRARRPQ